MSDSDKKKWDVNPWLTIQKKKDGEPEKKKRDESHHRTEKPVEKPIPKPRPAQKVFSKPKEIKKEIPVKEVEKKPVAKKTLPVAEKKHSRSPNDKSLHLEVTIKHFNENGAGVAFHNDRRLNIEKTLPGEKVLVEYSPERPKKSRLRLLEILEPVPERQEPECPYYAECGGCQLQHLEYDHQLTFKQNTIEKIIGEDDLLADVSVHPTVGMPDPYFYRNKTQMPYQTRNRAPVYGLFRSRTHEVISIDQCMVETRDANKALQLVKQWASQFGIEIYDEKKHTGLLRHVVVRRSAFSHQMMIVLVVTKREVPEYQELLKLLKMTLPNLTSVQLNINSTDSNVILGKENIPVWGEHYITEKLMQQSFRIYPSTFFQVNAVQMVKLLSKMHELVDFQEDDTVVDLYCGVGAISLNIAEKVKQVIGVEKDTDAIDSAQQNMIDNQIKNTKFIAEDAFAAFKELKEADTYTDIVIVDPPRKGLKESLIEAICETTPRQVVYISCNPKTLARDLAIFYNYGYQTLEIFPFDMFPQTHHVECLTVLQKAF